MNKPKKPSSNYFTKDTEEAIILYNSLIDPKERAKIFTEKIYYPFYKLAENIIHTFKFYYMDVEEVEDLKLEIVSMLLQEKIQKFKPEVGAKAYSYFGTIVKRWLISYNSANYRRLKRMKGLDKLENHTVDEVDMEINTASSVTLSEFLDKWIVETYSSLGEMFQKEAELEVADAVLTIFKTRQDFFIYKKKMLYIYIREITGCDTPYVTRVVARLKEDFYKKYEQYNKGGYILPDLP